MSWILGIGGYSHDASAALLHDGQLVAAVQEERLTRIKHQRGFPQKSIQFCLEKADIDQSSIDAIAFYTKLSNWDRLFLSVLGASIRHPGVTVSNPRGFINTLGFRTYMSLNFRADLARFFIDSGFSKKIFHAYDHHACHAASAYYSSPFDEAIVLCIDSVGDGRTTTCWVGEGNKLRGIRPSVSYPHSIAHVYNRITKYLGFPSTGDEYKVMGLAAYGEPRYLDQMRKLVIMRRDGSYRLNLKYFTFQYEYSFSDRFYEEFGPSRKPGDPYEGHYADMAASAQKLFEEVVNSLAIRLRDKTGIRNLCLAGGAALNSTSNGALIASGEFDDIFVPPAASDLGSSIGAAQYHWHEVKGHPREFRMKSDDYGPEYDDESIRESLDRYGMPYELVEDPAQTAADLIYQGNIVGWFQGRMEFGPRALGYRSILADPRDEGVKDRINKTIKFREEFRPFAPSVLRGHVKDFFEVDVNAPFMTFTLDILKERQTDIPGVVHVNGSGRLQTVSKQDQPLYYRLISRFHERSGVPVVLNTSFNLAGEPIVCSPEDAIRCFYTCGMDSLVIGNYLIQKR